MSLSFGRSHTSNHPFMYQKPIDMKKGMLFFALGCTLLFSSCDVIKTMPGMNTDGTVSESEAGMGIKEALSQGLAKAVLQLNKEDGFFKDELYKILLPPEAKKVESALRNLGMGNMVDKAILQINRGAENAAGYAKPIFADAIKSMTIQDAIGLIKNGDTSVTHFFREKTTTALFTAFKPVIQSSLDNVNATRYYGDIVNTYNNFPTTIKKVNPDLTGYVCDKAIGALFSLVAKEEQNIRANPLARTTDLLKKVFGGLLK